MCETVDSIYGEILAEYGDFDEICCVVAHLQADSIILIVKKVTLKKTVIRFRRWSRKAYAVFASLGRCVTIGRLRKGVTEQSLSKQKTTAGICQILGEADFADGTEELESELDSPRTNIIASLLLVESLGSYESEQDIYILFVNQPTGCRNRSITASFRQLLFL